MIPRFMCVLLVASWIAVPASAQTQLWGQPTAAPATNSLADLKGGGPVGLGFTAGTRNGMSLKIWPAKGHGIVIEFGAPTFLNSLAVGVGYRAHFKPLRPASGSIAALPYFGVNFRMRTMFLSDAPTFVELGGGLLMGCSVVVPDWPVELFFEAGPVIAGWKYQESTGMGVDVDGIAGARLYF